MGMASLAFYGSEQLGERASSSRIGWIAMFAVPALLIVVDPAAAQVSCSNGPLAFLGDVKTLTIQGVGIALFIMLVSAGGLKAAPFRGTSSMGNSLVGGFMVGVGFLVLGPALIDLADQTTPIDLSTQCNTGGNSGN
jgi:hypothetical protein